MLSGVGGGAAGVTIVAFEALHAWAFKTERVTIMSSITRLAIPRTCVLKRPTIGADRACDGRTTSRLAVVAFRASVASGPVRWVAHSGPLCAVIASITIPIVGYVISALAVLASVAFDGSG